MCTRASLLNRHNRSFLVLVLLLALFPVIATAQERITLVVSLRDMAGAGIPQARVIVRDSEGVQELAQAMTDSDGQATLPDLPNVALRIAVVGNLEGGTPLHQRGQDALGVLVFPDAATTRLDLRSEVDGAVIPDPVTMIAPDLAGVPDLTAAPVLDAGAGVIEPTPTTPAPGATVAPRSAPTVSPSSTSFNGWGLALLAVLLVVVAGVGLLGRRI